MFAAWPGIPPEPKTQNRGLPLNHGASPGEAAAEYDKEDVIVDLKPTGPMCLIEGDCDRGGRGVPVFF